ncbi:ABC transporter permease [Sulfurisphaera tokodaii]|uniref:ABC transporter permease protein n=2 Tax=Sulfurisphaera tokodaii TaxID=111955 RepID=Q970L4_SULTO|nr:ABC transporter permease [Sulfurisphaera tokodaii]BAB66659.1 putative ABC transporter permease protein [Sulfurisphaera tokodaii str. 7]HII73521.1 ABC transporter permease [Sulfurisphaera tokodaii]
MLREFIHLIIMQFKMIKAYLPAVIFYSIFFPLAFMFSFGLITFSKYLVYFISGTITFYISIGVFVSTTQTLSSERREGRFSLIVASGISRELYAISIAIAQGISTLIMIPVIVILGDYILHIVLKSVIYLLLSVIIGIFTFSMLGITLGLGIKNYYAVVQYSQILGFALTFFAPVYYPITFIPAPFRYLTYLEPTTYMSEAIYNSFVGNPVSLLWNLGCLIYGIALMIINTRILKST